MASNGITTYSSRLDCVQDEAEWRVSRRHQPLDCAVLKDLDLLVVSGSVTWARWWCAGDPAGRPLEAFELHDGQWLLIASTKDDDPISIRPFDAITFSLGDLWP